LVHSPLISANIIKNEGEKIISWILNLTDKECQYENSDIVRREWESLASPEIEYFEKNWELADEEGCEHSIISLIKDFRVKSQITVDIKQMKTSLESQGCIIKWNIIKNIRPRIDHGLG